MKDNTTTETQTESEKTPVEEIKAEKKKLLVILPRSVEGADSPYSFSRGSMHFAFVSSEEHSRRQCTAFLACREYLNRCFLSHFTNRKLMSSYVPGSDAPIDTNKLRLLIASGFDNTQAADAFKQHLFNAKAGINRYEELAGWQRSVICTVNHTGYKKKLWMITSPKEWISQPQLLSTFVLLLRFMCLHPTIDTASIESIHSSMLTLAVEYAKAKHDSNRSKFVHDSDIEGKFGNEDAIYRYAFFVKSAGELFKDIGMESAWPTTDKEDSFLTSSGIDRFVAREDVKYTDTVRTLQITFKDMWVKHNISEKEALAQQNKAQP